MRTSGKAVVSLVWVWGVGMYGGSSFGGGRGTHSQCEAVAHLTCPVRCFDMCPTALSTYMHTSKQQSLHPPRLACHLPALPLQPLRGDWAAGRLL